jgi:hypothetical protein
MTNGTLTIGGDLTVNSTVHTQSFYGTGTHKTRLVDGAGTQTITFSNPATNMQRFQDLTIQISAIL